MQISAHPLKLCKSDKMQGAEIENEGSVLKYMTESEIEEQRRCLLIMTQRHGFNTPQVTAAWALLPTSLRPFA